MENGKINVVLPLEYSEEDNTERIKKLIDKMYYMIAEKEVENSMEKMRKLVGLAPNEYRIKKTTSLWGSCSSNKKITINQNLMMYDRFVIDYAWTMSDMFEVKAMELIAEHLKNAVDNGSDEKARSGMAEAQYIAGMGFSNVGLGIVHSMAHPLGAFYDTPHGVANALLLPYVMEYNAESPSRAKYLGIARALGVDTAGMSVDEGVRAAVDAVRKLSLSVGIPQHLREIGVREEDIPALAVAAFNDVCTGGNPRPTSVEDITELYKTAY